VDIFSREDYPWLQFFSRTVVSVGLPGMDYGEVSSLLARTGGGFLAILHTGSAAKGTPQCLQTASGNFDLAGRDWILFRLKCLDEKIAPSLDLVLRLIHEADFSDQRRINDLVLEMKNEIDSGFASMGHLYAIGRAGRGRSRTRIISEKLGGISQIEFVYSLAKMDIGVVISKLRQLREKINNAGIIINLTGGDLDSAGKELKQRFSEFGPPAPRLKSEFFTDADKIMPKAEIFASQSLQVGFAAKTFDAAPFDTTEQIAEMVLTHQLSTGVLWEDIRMKGGAYGVSISSNSLENSVNFSTYRDPNPLRSLDVISKLLKDGLHKHLFDNADNKEDYLEKSIIGCYAKETYPMTSAEKGGIDFLRFLYGIENDYLKRRLERLINVSSADIESVFASFSSRASAAPVIISGLKTAEQAAKTLGVNVTILPL